MKTLFVTTFLILMSISAFTQVKITNTSDEFTGEKSKKSEVLKIRVNSDYAGFSFLESDEVESLIVSYTIFNLKNAYNYIVSNDDICYIKFTDGTVTQLKVLMATPPKVSYSRYMSYGSLVVGLQLTVNALKQLKTKTIEKIKQNTAGSSIVIDFTKANAKNKKKLADLRKTAQLF